jgi:hypothetical protein
VLYGLPPLLMSFLFIIVYAYEFTDGQAYELKEEALELNGGLLSLLNV